MKLPSVILIKINPSFQYDAMAFLFFFPYNIVTHFVRTLHYDPSIFSSVQSLSRVQLFATPWTTAHQASLSITNTQSLLKLMSLEPVMPSNHLILSSVQFSSVTQLCLTLCDPMNRSTPGLPVHHQLLEFTQTHIHRVGDAIQPSHPPSSPFPPAPNPSQHQSLFQ